MGKRGRDTKRLWNIELSEAVLQRSKEQGRGQGSRGRGQEVRGQEARRQDKGAGCRKQGGREQSGGGDESRGQRAEEQGAGAGVKETGDQGAGPGGREVRTGGGGQRLRMVVKRHGALSVMFSFHKKEMHAWISHNYKALF